MSLANVSIVGNLTRPPEQMYFASGQTKTTFVVAVNINRRSDKGEGADFYKVEAWGKLAELSAQYLAKGNQVTASGRLMMAKWTDKEGRDRVTPTIKAEQIAFPGRSRLVEGAAVTAIAGEIEFADENVDKDHAVADIKAAANVMMSPSAITTSRSADTAKVATTASLHSANGRKTQTA